MMPQTEVEGRSPKRPRTSRTSIGDAYRAQADQVQRGFLVVDHVLDTPWSELLELHEPQELVYAGNGTVGTSYTNSWKISTYCHTSPESYTHQVFKEKYGVPYNEPMRAYMESSGIMTQLEQLKSDFLECHCEQLALSEQQTAQMLAETVLSQMFLTVQPDKQSMCQIDTYMQPHYDPATLTINLHLSPVDYSGCDPTENGLLVFCTESDPAPTVIPTPQGAATFLWQRPDGTSCLHTANDISAGKRVVLCTFWQRRAPSTAAHGTQVADRVLRSMAVKPVPIPVLRTTDNAVSVPPVAALLYARERAVSLQLSQILTLGRLDTACSESAAAYESLTCTEPEETCELLERMYRCGLEEVGPEPLTEPAAFSAMRATALAAGVVGGKQLTRLLLCELPSVIAQVLGDCTRQLFLYNEQFVRLKAGQSECAWRCDWDELSMCLMGGQQSASFDSCDFHTLWLPLNMQHTINVMAAGFEAEAIAIPVQQGQAVLLPSHTHYSHATHWGTGHLDLWCLQYSTKPILSPDRNHPLAFAVPCELISQQLRLPTEPDELSSINGVLAVPAEGAESNTGLFMPLRRVGDCSLLHGLVWHRSIPSESDRFLLKLVVFFKRIDGAAVTDPEGRLGASFRLDAHELLDGCFGEVMCLWDSLHRLPPSAKALWSPYQGYQRTNSTPAPVDVRDADQLQNVRRVDETQMAQFRGCAEMQCTSKVIEQLTALAVSKSGRELAPFDLHFLRQFGANAASFSAHQDVQDTGDPVSTEISVAISVLVGGWREEHLCEAQVETVHDECDSEWLQYCASEDRAEMITATSRVTLLVESVVHSSVAALTDSIAGCDCGPSGCSAASCRCTKLGTETAATAESVQCGASLFECNSSCACGPQCSNRATQRPLYSSPECLQVFSCGVDKGLGVRALKRIPAGSFVLCYVGEVISADEAGRRRKQHEKEMNYLIVIRESVPKTGEVMYTAMDARHHGNVARFINHSCEPNLSALCVRIDTMRPHLALYARREIEAGEELSISYGSVGTEHTSSLEANVTRKPCFCGASRCCGFLPFDLD